MNLLREKLRARGHHVLRCSDSPDMSGANQAAVMQAQLSAEQLAFVKQVYRDTAPDRKAAQKRAQQVSDAQLAQMRQQDELTKKATAHHESTFLPLEKKIATSALEYDTAARREQEAGQAMADVDSQAALARETAAREAAARGVDPSSGNFVASMAQQGTMSAAAKAAAGNAARKQVETIGAAKMADAASLGRNIASSQATTASLALNAGNSSVNNSQAALGTATSGAGLMNQGYGAAQAGYAGAANTYLGIAKTEGGDGGAAAAAGLGSAVGGIAMAI